MRSLSSLPVKSLDEVGLLQEKFLWQSKLGSAKDFNRNLNCTNLATQLAYLQIRLVADVLKTALDQVTARLAGVTKGVTFVNFFSRLKPIQQEDSQGPPTSGTIFRREPLLQDMGFTNGSVSVQVAGRQP